MQRRPLRRIALIGSYLPRPCGIATFSHDCYTHLRAARPDWDISVLALNDPGATYDYPPEVHYEIDPTPEGYARVAAYLEAKHFDAIYLQHEYGLFAGAAGNQIFEMLDRVRTPLVTMLHTVLKTPDEDQFRVLRRLAGRSSQVITMNEVGRQFLQNVFEIDDSKIAVVPHGIPDTPPADPADFKARFDLSDRQVALTFGLLSPGKGIENAIAAVPSIVQRHPDFTYVVLGATHPHLVKQEGEVYRESLMAQARQLGVAENVRFVNRFVELDELTQWLRACDIYLTPYLNEAQITSGTLAYAYGCGNAVVSTPYWHAADLLADGRGRLVQFGSGDAIANAILELLDDEATRLDLRDRAYEAGRLMTWPRVGDAMAGLLESAHNQMFAQVDLPSLQPSLGTPEHQAARVDALDDVVAGNRSVTGGLEVLPAHSGEIVDETTGTLIAQDAFALAAEPTLDDPLALHGVLAQHVDVQLEHLARLTDPTGLVQHATFDTPNWHEGYCVDDNVRALLLSLHLSRHNDAADWFDDTQRLESLTTTYRAFVNYAIDPETFVVRNFMGFDRRWLENRGSDDSIGRVAWTLGSAVAMGDRDTSGWAATLFDHVLDQCVVTRSPRTWAFAILGAADYQLVFDGERRSRQHLCDLATRLQGCFDAVADDSWQWFEGYLTYDNAKLPHAMIAAGLAMERDDWLQTGLRSLHWLCQVQTAPQGCFRPVGNQGFYQRGKTMATFDQQPLEAWATVSATLAAAQADPDVEAVTRWRAQADRALAWFLGLNDLRTPIAIVESGSCHDGLQYDRVNRNQGAESTLSWLLAATQWKAHSTAQRPKIAAVTTDGDAPTLHVVS